jgi:phosphoglycolate phosphatase-like HAD superfamily hydrolase
MWTMKILFFSEALCCGGLLSVDAWNETLWNGWVNNASAPALDAMLSLYTDLRAQNWSFAFITGRPESQREQTAQNLAAAGYSDWATLVLRSVPSFKLFPFQHYFILKYCNRKHSLSMVTLVPTPSSRD